MKDVEVWRALIDEYVRLDHLDGCTPQSRGQRFNGVIAELLECWGIAANADSRSKGEIDVGFTHEGVRYVLEAKWEKKKADTGELAKFQKRVQQRISGTRGVFLAMAGYTPEAIGDLSDGQRLEMLLLDRSHWEAMLSGLVPAPELLTLAGDHAAFRGEAFASLAALLAGSARTAEIKFNAAAHDTLIVEASSLQSDIRPVLSVVGSDQLGMTSIGADELLLTTSTGIVRVNVADAVATTVVRAERCHRRPVLLPDGSILFTRGLGVGRFQGGVISSVAGGAAGATCLCEAPDGSTWLLDNGEPSGLTPASISRIGRQFNEQTRYDLAYPSATATNAAWIADHRLVVIGAAGFQSTMLGEDSSPLQPPSQANPMGLLHVVGNVLLTAGDGISLAATDVTNGVSTELARLGLAGSISELTQSGTGVIYVAAYNRLPDKQTYTVVRLGVVTPEDILPSMRAPASASQAGVAAPPTPVPGASSEAQDVPASASDGCSQQGMALPAFDQAAAALADERTREHQHGYRDGVAFVPELGWSSLSSLAEHDFDLKSWLEGWRNGWLDVELGRAPAGAEAAGWLPGLADRLGTYVDVFGHEEWSFTPSSTYVEGFVAALRAVWSSASHTRGNPSLQTDPLWNPHAPTPDARGELGGSAAATRSTSRSSAAEVVTAESAAAFVTVKGILGSINFDGETVTIRKEGYGPRMKGVRALSIDTIENVIVKPATAMFHGYIQFVVRDHPPAPDRRFTTASGRPHREDPDSMSFARRANGEIENLRTRVEAAIAQAKQL